MVYVIIRSLLKHIDKICMWIGLAIYLIYIAHDFEFRISTKIKVDELVTLKKYSPLSKWLLIKSSYQETCHFYAQAMTNWTVLCITNDYSFEIRFENEKVIRRSSENWLKNEMLLSEFNSDAIFYYLAITQGAHMLYTLNSNEILNHTQFRKSLLKFNDEHLTGVLYNATHVNNYQIKPFNSSIYYGCYSIEEYNDINDTHRFPQHCYDGILPAIYTPAYFESSRVGSENCDRKMPDIAIPRNNFIYFEIKKSFFSTCSFWFLPVFEPVLKDGLENVDLIYKCFVQWAVWQLGCFTSVYWESYLTREFSALNVASECHEAVKDLTPCQNLTIDEHCFLENSKKILSDVSVKKLFNWINVLNNINFKPKQMNSTKECLVNSSLILHPVRQQVINNSVKYRIENVNFSQSFYIKTCSENVPPSVIPKNLINLSKPWIQQPNVLLLIVFNYPHPEVIPLLEIIHRPIYPYILYCGFEMLKQNLIINYRISFATYFQQHGQTAGSLNYQCILKAMRMGYDIDGIFLIADDVFIKTELSNLNIEKNKFFRIGLVGDLKFMKQCSPPSIDCSLPMIWYRWGGFGGSLHTILSEWRELGEKHPELKIARERLQNFTKAEMRMWGSTADIGYLSKAYFKTAYKMLHMFSKHQVFLEIALPTTLTSITKSEDEFILLGHMDWTNNRYQHPYQYINNLTLFGKHFAHPMKLSCVLNKNVNCLKMFCKCLMPYYYDPQQKLCNSI